MCLCFMQFAFVRERERFHKRLINILNFLIEKWGLLVCVRLSLRAIKCLYMYCCSYVRRFKNTLVLH